MTVLLARKPAWTGAGCQPVKVQTESGFILDKEICITMPAQAKIGRGHRHRADAFWNRTETAGVIQIRLLRQLL